MPLLSARTGRLFEKLDQYENYRLTEEITTMTSTTQKLAVEIRKTVKAPAERVFAAWTEPNQIAKWMGSVDRPIPRITQDFVVGGDYRIDGIGSGATDVFGTYKEIVPGKKIVYSWSTNSKEYPAYETLVTVEFIQRGDQTEIVLVHNKFQTENVAKGHAVGWQGGLDKLAQLVESELAH